MEMRQLKNTLLNLSSKYMPYQVILPWFLFLAILILNLKLVTFLINNFLP